ncbi:RNA helicase OS=Streptomyces glaucescens OX=1907 GN=SGLAU_26975 PE=4 SV=1 [Streptomyces glaucescens]
MNRTRTNDRFARTRDGSAGSGRAGSRFGSRPRAGPAHRAAPAVTAAAPPRSGEFALPETITPALPAAETFTDLGMPGQLLAELGKQGVTAPFPIQAATLPNSIAGRDVLGRGRTGSGKTLAFGLALLARTAGPARRARQPPGLILVQRRVPDWRTPVGTTAHATPP